jgi:hypothetical protein
MSFESRVLSFSERFLSARSHELIVAPALADLQFEEEQHGQGSRLAVVRALVGAVGVDFSEHAGTFLALTLVPACYYFVLIAVCFDFFSGAAGRGGLFSTAASVAAPLLLMSLLPVVVCFWPSRNPVQRVE